MSAVKDFPDVDPDQITALGRQFQSVASELSTAGSKVQTVAASTSWSTPDAKPSWDLAMQARQSDIANAHDVMEHIGNVLRMTGAEVANSKSDYEVACLTMQYEPDPRIHPLIMQGGVYVVDPNPPAVDPQQLAEYLALVRKANDAVDDANYLLALCARELLAVSEGVSFAQLPKGAPTAVDPKTFTIFPFSPAFGAPSGAVYANGVPVPPQFGQGRAFEGNILRELGISGGSKDFFRPDANGNYALPRTKSGTLFRGTFPDSMRAGLLEIKSGTSEITMNMPQIRIQQWVARTLGIKWNIVTARDTPIDPKVISAIRQTGGGVYARVSGEDNVYYDRLNDDYVHLQGGGGASGRDLVATPLTDDEKTAMENAQRLAARMERFDDGDSAPPSTVEGPSTPYVTENEYDDAWAKADISPDGDTPLPGMPEDDVPGEPLEPGEPLPEIPEEPIIPIGPEDLIP